jgi:mono/diheme cytochrome c family protein
VTGRTGTLEKRLFYGRNRGFLTSLAAVGTLLLGPGSHAFAAGEKQLPVAGSAEGSAGSHPESWGLLEKNCSKCHNSTDWAGGVAYDTMTPETIAEDADVWEKAIRKLRGRLMPPPGEPQPDQKTIDSFVTWMEGKLDSAAAASPDPGYVGLHRLNRTEYAREIDRLLGLHVEVKTLLPKDVSSDGFDNIASVLRISPAFLDQYITAARNVSRQAIGRANAKPSTRQFRVDASSQAEHIDGLPLGTRGGLLIDHYFPADGEYEFNIRDFFFGGAGYINRVDHPHKVIMTIDDVRVFESQVGGKEDLYAVDTRQAAAADELQSRFNHIRVKIKAGPHKVGVAFVQRSFAQSDAPLQPIAMLPEMERYPTIPGVDIAGPFNPTGVSETESRKRIFICRPASEAEEPACARRILANLAGEAFRRPVTDEDLKAPLDFYAMGRKAGDFEAGIESGLTSILSSTKFLFRAEPAVANVTPGNSTRLTDLELASRLSFFIWSSGPDQPLIELATAGRLSDPKVLEAQVHRMLADPRSETLVTNFAFQWLNVGRIDSIQPDPVVYPDFDPDLRNGFREEIRLFLGSVLRNNHSVLDLLRSDETYLNERLALHYDVPNVRGAQFRPVRLTNANRWGLLGKGAVLMGTSYGNRTSPVLRGAWILENITGTPPSSPPPGVEQFKENEPGKKASTVRERLEQHRENPSCNGCHGVMDPLGFALENYDVVGGWRDIDRDAGDVIDSSGVLSNGMPVSGPDALNKALLARPDQFAQAFTEKLMVFALGRALRHQDMPAVREIVRRAAKDDYRFESIIRGVASSQAFQMRQLPVKTPETKQAMVTSDERAR